MEGLIIEIFYLNNLFECKGNTLLEYPVVYFNCFSFLMIKKNFLKNLI